MCYFSIVLSFDKKKTKASIEIEVIDFTSDYRLPILL